jgi:hypothetical protein
LIFEPSLEILEFEKMCQNWHCKVLKFEKMAPTHTQTTYQLDWKFSKEGKIGHTGNNPNLNVKFMARNQNIYIIYKVYYFKFYLQCIVWHFIDTYSYLLCTNQMFFQWHYVTRDLTSWRISRINLGTSWKWSNWRFFCGYT